MKNSTKEVIAITETIYKKTDNSLLKKGEQSAKDTLAFCKRHIAGAKEIAETKKAREIIDACEKWLIKREQVATNFYN